MDWCRVRRLPNGIYVHNFKENHSRVWGSTNTLILTNISNEFAKAASEDLWKELICDIIIATGSKIEEIALFVNHDINSGRANIY